jgi:hypothetical protein
MRNAVILRKQIIINKGEIYMGKKKTLKQIERKEKIANVVDKTATVVAIVEAPFACPWIALGTKAIAKKVKKNAQKEKDEYLYK